MQKELTDELKEIVIPDGDNILEMIIGFITKDPIIFIKEIKKMMGKPTCISDILYWNNFKNFLVEGNFSYDMIRKLSAKIADEGDSRESAVKIVESIGKIDEPIKAKYIANLTSSLINGSINKIQYFRLINTVERLISADLLYIAENVEHSGIINSDSHIDEFLASGIIMMVEGGFAYTEKAYDLVEFGIRFGHAISKPQKLPPRLIMAEMTNEEIDNIIQETGMSV